MWGSYQHTWLIYPAWLYVPVHTETGHAYCLAFDEVLDLTTQEQILGFPVEYSSIPWYM